jgi:ribosomal protein S18 acetylase RimI-like enzyme
VIVGACRTRGTVDGEDATALGPRAAEVLEVFVVPDRRRAGLGRRLFGHAVNDLLVRGRAPVFVRAPDELSGALAFFARQGFRPDGEGRLVRRR